jgi:polar amino acid transport system substrate-binding protein
MTKFLPELEHSATPLSSTLTGWLQRAVSAVNPGRTTENDWTNQMRKLTLRPRYAITNMHETTHDKVAPSGTASGRTRGRVAGIRRSRGLAAGALAVGLSLALAACGGSSGGSGPSAGGTPTAKGGTAPATSGVSLDNVTVNEAARALLPADIRSSGVLSAGFNAPSPPFWYISTKGSTTYSGVEYDLIQAIGKSLGLKVKLTNQAWDGLMPALTAKRYDVIISNIGDKPERRTHINFVDYGKTGTGLLVLAKNTGKYHAQSDLCGTTIGAQTGALQVGLLQDISSKVCAGGKPINIKALSDLKGLFPALLSGQIDLLALDTPAVAYWASLKQTGAAKYATVLGNIQAPGLLYGVGVNNSNPELARAVQASFQGLQKSGIYQKIWDAGKIGNLTISDFTINGKPTL